MADATAANGAAGGTGDFTFPTLQKAGEEPKRLPLTAFSTVTDRSSGAAAPQAVPLTEKAPRSKVPLEKGYSQVDWMRLTTADKAGELSGLSGQPLRKDITMEEVRRHRTAEDAWMVLRGRVYNIGPYLRFHPGGADVLLRAAGKDGTALFMKYHPWVNAEALLAKCLIGQVEPPAAALAAAGGAAEGAAAGSTKL